MEISQGWNKLQVFTKELNFIWELRARNLFGCCCWVSWILFLSSMMVKLWFDLSFFRRYCQREKKFCWWKMKIKPEMLLPQLNRTRAWWFKPWIGQLKHKAENKCKVNEGKNPIESLRKILNHSMDYLWSSAFDCTPLLFIYHQPSIFNNIFCVRFLWWGYHIHENHENIFPHSQCSMAQVHFNLRGALEVSWNKCKEF